MKIQRNITIGELVRNYPESVKVLFAYGLGCVGCPSAQAETIEEACAVHGLDVETLIKNLNDNIK